MFISYDTNGKFNSRHFKISNLPTPEETTLPFYITSFGKTYEEIDVSWVKSTKCFLVYSLKGSGKAYFNNEWHTVPEGSLMYLPAEHPTRYTPLDENRWTTIYFTYSCKSNDTLLGDTPFVLTDQRLSFIPELLAKMCSPDNINKTVDSEELYACYFYLITKVRNLSSKIVTYSKQTQTQYDISKTMIYVAEHFDEDISLSQLAQMCHISQEYYCKMFKKAQGISLTEYIKTLRISKVCELLIQNPNEKISTIGNMCGFRNTPYFHKVFKKEKGITPDEYRKLYATKKSTVLGNE